MLKRKYFYKNIEESSSGDSGSSGGGGGNTCPNIIIGVPQLDPTELALDINTVYYSTYAAYELSEYYPTCPVEYLPT